ncbi:MAG: 2-isopropylmalate synthase [Candidatus Omnitrophota bacterium]|jgi:2-isopropylmalate synthase|nr:MAG: 2-isopropylmalate synthase [Candidatus Omnitrophota bacterium]
MNDDKKIIIFDTTLRDGEQSPGFSMNLQEKLEFAFQLKRLGVDVIEAGFPISSPGDFEAVKAVAQQVEGPQICGLARAMEKDIDRCWEAVQYSSRPRIHTFIATSNIHVEKKLKKTNKEVRDIAVKAVKRARGYTENVEFSTEDAARTDRDYICEVIEATIDAGAATINVPDTVGYSNPWEFGDLIAYIFEKVKNVHQAVISVHCHNDLGLAVSNSLAAVRSGARQVECTINGIGERAGNASLEEIVMNIETRKNFFDVHTNIHTEQIYPTSRLLTRFTGIGVQPNKAIVGANAFAHEAGIHQDGMLKERTTYEIMSPQSVGWTGHSMVLGKHSGRHAFTKRLEELGFHLEGESLEKAFDSFKELADLKKNVFDEDIIAIVDEQSRAADYGKYSLEDLSINIEKQQKPNAHVRLRSNGDIVEATGAGAGALDAAFSVIKQLTGMEDAVLVDYHVGAVTTGTDALGSANIILRKGDREVIGRGTDTDVLRASVKAFLNAVNRLIAGTEREKTYAV